MDAPVRSGRPPGTKYSALGSGANVGSAGTAPYAAPLKDVPAVVATATVPTVLVSGS
jgi:hypothetical protein